MDQAKNIYDVSIKEHLKDINTFKFQKNLVLGINSNCYKVYKNRSGLQSSHVTGLYHSSLYNKTQHLYTMADECYDKRILSKNSVIN